MRPTIFLDTNVFKFAATRLPRYVPRQQRVQWGPLQLDVTVHDEQFINPNQGIQNVELKVEADLLPCLAALGKAQTVRYVIAVEALYEQWGLPNLDSATGSFYGCPVDLVEAPFRYARVMGGLGVNGQEEQMRFLCSIQDERFLAYQRATGAYQGLRQPNRNQLLDAFHLWCAEHNKCDFFLTLDFKLLNVLARSRLQRKVRAVKPSELHRAIEDSTNA
jgi:hypothetical protein